MWNIVTKPACAGSNTDATMASNAQPDAIQSRLAKKVADLQWQIKFTQMKIDDWPEQANCQWMNLARMQEHAKRTLAAVAG